MPTKLFAHSRLDGLLILLALVQFVVLFAGVATFGTVPWGWSLVIGLVAVFLTCTNTECIAHNFIHNPFFIHPWLNRAFAVFNTLLIGTPQSVYRIQHLHHHKYNNDRVDPGSGTTEDFTSTWRYSRRLDREEGILTYAILGYFRSDIRFLFREARNRALLGGVALESLALLAMVLAFAAVSPLGLVYFYLPVWLIGNFAAQAQNYLEHYGAFPGDRTTDAVSSYGTLYNLIWFNHGYHQEHHYRPQVHWSRIPEVQSMLPPVSERRVVRGAHWFNFGPREELPAAPINELNASGDLILTSRKPIT